MLESEPALVGLQEWYVARLRLLREFGDVRVVPGWHIGRRGTPSEPAYHWVSAVAGGNAVGVRADRYEPLSSRVAFLCCVGRSDLPIRFLRTEHRGR